MRRQIDVRTLFLGFVHPNLLGPGYVREVYRNYMRQKVAILDLEVWDRLELPNVETLVMGRGRVVRARTHSGGEVVGLPGSFCTS